MDSGCGVKQQRFKLKTKIQLIGLKLKFQGKGKKIILTYSIITTITNKTEITTPMSTRSHELIRILKKLGLCL